MLSLADRADVRNPSVSAWSVGQQIEHCCLTMRSTAAAIRQGRDQPALTALNAFGRQVFRSGEIPRGRVQAPGPVGVADTPSPETLRRSLAKARSAVETLDPSAKAGPFEHPFFGILDQAHSLRFIEIHNAHHLAIVRDILEARVDDEGSV